MDADQIEDLKQYIATTISQVTADLVTKNDLSVLQNDLAMLQSHIDSRFDEIQQSIAESLSVTNDSVDEQISTHDLRITKLEQHTTH